MANGPGGQAPSAVWQNARQVASVADLAALLRQLRRREARRRGEAELTHRQLADRTGWSHAIIGQYFAGNVLPPTDRFDVLVGLLGATAAEQGALATARDRIEEGRRATAPADSPVSPPRQLPIDVPGFAGRGAELDRLDALLDPAHQPPAVVITAVSGAAGIGKTALAVHWGHRISSRFPDGQLYVNLRGFDPTGPPMDPTTAVRGFLHALAVRADRIPPDPHAQAALYRSLLADKRVLVVLDNARDSEQVRPLLPSAPGCLVVVTSRNQLTGLVVAEGANPIPVDLLTADEARQLLIGRLGPDAVKAEPEAVDDIIALTAGLPLALAIVAARAAVRPDFPLSSFAAQLRDSRRRLDALDAGEPVTDVRAVFTWSYRTLTADAARLFRLIGPHPGPDVSAAAAASLAGLAPDEVRPLLGEISRAHLIDEHTPDRYRQHDLLRAYASELAHTTDSDEHRNAATHRLLDYVLHTAYAADQLLHPNRRDLIDLSPPRPGVTTVHLADYEQTMAWFTAEHQVLLAAVEHAAAAGFDTHAWQVAWTLTTFLDRRGHWREWVAVERIAVAAAERLADPRAQARAHRSLATAYARLDLFDDARHHLGRTLELWGQVGDQAGQAHAHHNLARLCGLADDPAGALDHASQALDLYRAAGHRSGQAYTLNAVGWYQILLGNHQVALDACQRAQALFRELDNQEGQACTWDSIGYANHHLGRYAEALACYGRALATYQDLGDRYPEADTLTHVGDTQHAAGNPHAARDAWQQALAIFDDLSHSDAERVRAKLNALDRSRPT